ncbi:Zinc finger CCHC domain-containing protein 10 [Sparganum proliferum]
MAALYLSIIAQTGCLQVIAVSAFFQLRVQRVEQPFATFSLEITMNSYRGAAPPVPNSGPRLPAFYLSRAADSKPKYCQKCLQEGHWTYECKGKRKYLERESRTSRLQRKMEKIDKKASESKHVRRKRSSSSSSSSSSSESSDSGDSGSSDSSSSSDSETSSNKSSTSSSSSSSSCSSRSSSESSSASSSSSTSDESSSESGSENDPETATSPKHRGN